MINIFKKDKKVDKPVNSFEVFMEEVLQNEGYFTSKRTVFDLKDGAGMTHKSGITERVYARYLQKSKVTFEEMEEMTFDQIKDIYKNNYWIPAKCHKLPKGVDFLVGDMAINAGVGRASKLLQRAVGAVEDGKIGPKTLKAIEDYNGDLVDRYSQIREDFYKSLKNFNKFGKGWLNRVEHAKEIAKGML